jgi:RNA polymerase sigma factor (sigma-70 family)
VPSTSDHRASPVFLTTHWSVVSLALESDSPEGVAALEELCRSYWFPLYAYVRRQGRSPHDAQDLTQMFFAQLLEKNYLRAADRNKGRFRTFLLVALKRFLFNEWDRANAQKRGGCVTMVPLDVADAESRFVEEPGFAESADRDYERRWAMTLLERAISELRAEYERLDRIAEFERLKQYLTAERGTIHYAPVATSLGLTEAGARTAVHRIRKRFREVFRAAVSATVSTPEEIDNELSHVVRALSYEPSRTIQEKTS